MSTPEEQRDPRAQPSPANDGRRLTPVVHARGSSGRVDALLDLMSFLARPSALSTALDELPRRITRLFPCDVCSIYLLEGDELVMRGNLGFPAEALGEVRMAVGCGITGLSVECMRPLSLDVAASHASNRVFPGLGEERFPIFMAVPVAGPRGPLGALVLRRREPPAFTTADLELAVALTAPIAAMVERAHIAATRHAPRLPVTSSGSASGESRSRAVPSSGEGRSVPSARFAGRPLTPSPAARGPLRRRRAAAGTLPRRI